MIACPDCNNRELEGSFFCTVCGAPLAVAGEDTQTVTLPFSDTLSEPAPLPLVGKSSRPDSRSRSIRFVIPVSGRQISVPMADEVKIGRADPFRNIFPELDLTDDGGKNAGISRLHAIITTTAQGIAIMDLNSVNGTRVNNHPLPPHLPYALASGDELKLGHLLLHVFLEET